jgi:hypothetical protein
MFARYILVRDRTEDHFYGLKWADGLKRHSEKQSFKGLQKSIVSPKESGLK